MMSHLSLISKVTSDMTAMLYLGSDPEVLKPSSGKSAVSEIEKMISSQGLSWQQLPALRPSTQESLGCGTFSPDLKSSRQKQPLADLCVVLLAPNGPLQQTGRSKTLKLSSFIHSLHTNDVKGWPSDDESEYRVKASAKAVSEGKLRISWMDSDAQRDFCHYHFDQVASEPNKEGSMKAINRNPCGQPVTYESILNQVKEILESFLSRLRGKKLSLAEEARRRRPAFLLAFRPVASAASRDGLGRPLAPSKRLSYVYSVLDLDLSDPNLDLSEPHGSANSRLHEIVDWIARAHASSLQAPKTSAGSFFGQTAKPPLPPLQSPPTAYPPFPPPLVPDDQPSTMDKIATLISDSKEWIVRSLSYVGIDISVSLLSSKELYGTVVILALMILVQFVWSKVAVHPDPPHFQPNSYRERPAQASLSVAGDSRDVSRRQAIHDVYYHGQGAEERSEAERDEAKRLAREEMDKRDALRKRLKDPNEIQ